MCLGIAACGRQDRAAPARPPAASPETAVTATAEAGEGDCIACWLLPVGPAPLVLENQVYGAQLLVHGNRAELILDSLLGHDPDGKARWQLRGRFPLAVLTDSQTVSNTCGTSRDSADLRTVAVVRNAGTEWFEVIRAWRIRPEQFAVDSLPPATVSCFVEGFGEND